MPIIRIKQYQFTLSDPFNEGHVLTSNEARALNALRAENIRNNLEKILNREIGKLPDSALLSASTLSEMNDLATRYDREYEFGSRRTYQKAGGLIEREALTIARGHVLAHARSAGLNLTEIEIEAASREKVRDPEVLAEARSRAEEHQRVANQALDDLF